MHSNFIGASVIFIINEGNLVALLVYSSKEQRATGSPRRISVATSSGSQIHPSSAQGWIEYGMVVTSPDQ